MLSHLQTIHGSTDNREKGDLARGQHQFKNRYHLSSTVYLYPPQASNFHSVPTFQNKALLILWSHTSECVVQMDCRPILVSHVPP